jgi:Flp pilus assembly protein TadB
VTGLALLCGLFVVGGLAFAASGLARRPVPAAARARRRRGLPTPERVAAIGGVALITLLLTRWPVAAVAAGLAVALLSGTRSALGKRTADADLVEALTAWAEMLRDATGTPRGIEGVLVATAPGAPPLIRPAVARVAQRLPYDPLDVALDDLAEDLAHPVGDLVVTALRLAARSGGRQIRSVLDDLAAVAREEARMHRRVEVARARPRADMRSVLLLMGAFVLLFSAVARDYLAPYGTPLGQLVLALVLGIWAAGIWAMARLGRTSEVERFLAKAPR